MINKIIGFAICWLGKLGNWGLKISFLEMNSQSVVDLNTKNDISK